MRKSVSHLLLIFALLFAAKGLSAAHPVRLNLAEKGWLDEHKVIKVGVVDLSAPILSFAGRMQPKGVAVDYLHALTSHLGLQIELKRFADARAMANALDGGEIDLIGAAVYGLDEIGSRLYTRPYLSLPVALFGSDDLSVSDLSDLSGRSIAVVAGGVWDAGLSRVMPGVNLVTFPSMEDALKAVAANKVAGYLGDVASTEYLLERLGVEDVEERLRTQWVYEIAMAASQQAPVLQSLMQKGLERISEDELNGIWLRWPNVERPQNIETAFPVWVVLLPLFVVWTLAVAWGARRYTKQEHFHQIGRMKATLSRLRRREKSIKTKSLRLKHKALSYRRELRKYRQQISLLKDVMPSAAWVWDAETGQCQWDESMYGFFQVEEENFEPTPEAILERVHEADRDRVSALFSADGEGNELQISYRVVLADGTTRWMLDYSHSSLDEGLSQRVGICWDVSEYRQMAVEGAES